MLHKSLTAVVMVLIIALESVSIESRTGPAHTVPVARPGEASPLRSPLNGQVITGPVDPNFAEYVYQQGLLALGRNDRAWAVELLRFYAQTGSNPKQIAKALQLVAAHGNGQ